MKERFAVYNTTTGQILSGGLIDRQEEASRPVDTSIMTALIQRSLARNPGADVIYLPANTVIDPATHKIEGGQVVDRTQTDKDDYPTRRELERLIRRESRRLAIASLKARGKWPIGAGE